MPAHTRQPRASAVNSFTVVWNNTQQESNGATEAGPEHEDAQLEELPGQEAPEAPADEEAREDALGHDRHVHHERQRDLQPREVALFVRSSPSSSLRKKKSPMIISSSGVGSVPPNHHHNKAMQPQPQPQQQQQQQQPQQQRHHQQYNLRGIYAESAPAIPSKTGTKRNPGARGSRKRRSRR